MLKKILLLLTMLWLLPVSADSKIDESIGLEFPVEDAKSALTRSHYEFVGIEYADGIELVGLDEQQSEIVKEKYHIRLLNFRWQSFTNIEGRHSELERMRAYALRYNLTMWQGLKQQQMRDIKRYRY